MTVSPYRLPTHVVPSRYQLDLAVDIDASKFRGSVLIDADILEPTNEIVCNAADLEIQSTEVLTQHGTNIDCTFHTDNKTQRLHLNLANPLEQGQAQIKVSFAGLLNNELRGFYRSTYCDEDGTTQQIATTQFQATDARRAFPCWDEPAFKAKFATTLEIDPQHFAFSNTAITHQEETADGRLRVSFAETMPMSTYLVAFVVGPLQVTEPVVVDGVEIRVVHRIGSSHLTDFALQVAQHGLRWFSDYYAIPYPSDKLDLVAIPDFAFGAMENLGCITFREVLLLVDPEKASQTELQNVALVINHEIAHMWFGDLVTMKWWEGIWLNEAFATFMEISCTDAFCPEWQLWHSFGRSRSSALATDALVSTRAIEFTVHTPDQAEQMFDVITYEKGAAVLKMLEQYLGAARFRRGVRHYLDTYKYANTNTGDLWDCLESASGEPIRQMMDSWIYQSGFPLIELEDTPHGLTISQRHFTLNRSAAEPKTWAIPLIIKQGLSDETYEQRLLLNQQQVTVTNCSLEDVLTVNAAGFYRVRPSSATIAAAIAGKLGASERHNVVDDAWALTLSGDFLLGEFLELSFGFIDEADATVWSALAHAFNHTNRVVRDIDRHNALFVDGVSDLAHRAVDRIGMLPGDQEDNRTRELRATLVTLLGTVVCDQEMVSRAAQLSSHQDATLASAALSVIAHHGHREEFQAISETARLALDPQTKQRNQNVLADFQHEELIDELLADVINGAIRSQDGPYLIRRALANQSVGWRVWQFVTANWDDLLQLFPHNSVARMLEGIIWLDRVDQANEVSSFLAQHPVPQGERPIKQHLERQQIHTNFRTRTEQLLK